MFDRFSENARQTAQRARAQAERLGHDFVAPEHFLLAILADANGHAAQLLRALGADPDLIAAMAVTEIRPGDAHATGQVPFTPAARRMLEQTVAAAATLGARHVGTEHLLVGLAAAEPSLPARLLVQAGVGPERLLEALREREPAPTPSRRQLLLISNSTMHGGGYLAHCADELRSFLGPRKRVVFLPYALFDHDTYAARAAQAFDALGHDLLSLHARHNDPAALAEAEAVFIGGGNTFRLLSALYHYELIEPLRDLVGAGLPYIGSSAGTNVATLSIRTTNDMPIVQPPTFTALQLVPFQINPHYLDPDPHSRHMGETREERIRQFHEEHATPVLGLREGCLLRVAGDRAELRGTTRARLFRRGAEPAEYTPPCDLSFLLRD